MSMILKKQCPCCNQKLSFWDYEFKVKNKDNKKVMICRHCENNIIIEKQTIKIRIILFIFLAFIILSMLGVRDIVDFFIVFFILAIPSALIDYMTVPVKCTKYSKK